ncbi:hypothetical protein CORC01_13446 [Colletotrichum orchidophilum]|uniref:Uncharacterized protein n=1 Tax=Colletotrichum orchidophilum TaxID=1209926 RepID=A0A1G4AQ61_9PEZI|nr:uncharacterized protein CORC01_13446 [Colletotrichum orchidophilum]OHE91246.1 hypothetical protein CORC01_13446 [Colletotrichum orchidophilum]
MGFGYLAWLDFGKPGASCAVSLDVFGIHLTLPLVNLAAADVPSTADYKATREMFSETEIVCACSPPTYGLGMGCTREAGL